MGDGTSGRGDAGRITGGAGTAASTVEREVAFGRLHAPAGVASAPGLVLVHDVWGRTEHSRTLGRKLAAAGFGVLELDLYRAMAEPRVTDPGERIRSLDDARTLADLDAAADWLADEPPCRGRRIGVIGVCMGGTFALLAACHSTRFSAAAPFYGLLSYDHGMHVGAGGRDRAKKPVSPLECAARLRMPLFASFGREDGFVPEQDVDRLEVELARSGERFRVERHAGAGHAFLNETREDAYRPALAARALADVAAFLHAALD